MTLATWRGVTDSLVAIIRLQVSSLPITRCLKVLRLKSGFRPKETPFIFSSIDLHIMERSQNWSDLKSPTSKFRDTHFIDIVTDIIRWEFQDDRSFGLAMTNIQSFSEERSLDVTWWPDHELPGSEIFIKCAKKMYEQLCQKRRRFPAICEKPEGGVFKHPRPARRGIS